MPSIGDTLREARMRQRLDISDVEERTKIRAKYLRALENEEFGLLPGATFVKTFLRTYAEALGLDPHALVEEYRQSFESGEETEAPLGPPAAAGRERERRYGGGPPPRGMIAAIAIVVVIGFLLVLGLTGNGDDNGGKSKKTSQTAAQKAKRERARKQRKQRAKPAATTVVLKVAPETPTYACVDNGAGTNIVYQGILQQAQTFKGKRLRINLGKSSVQLNVNGTPVQFQQTPNPVGFDFTPTGHKELPSGQRPCASPGA
jgi:cytoskeleton protein RodZ